MPCHVLPAALAGCLQVKYVVKDQAEYMPTPCNYSEDAPKTYQVGGACLMHMGYPVGCWRTAAQRCLPGGGSGRPRSCCCAMVRLACVQCMCLVGLA